MKSPIVSLKILITALCMAVIAVACSPVAPLSPQVATQQTLRAANTFSPTATSSPPPAPTTHPTPTSPPPTPTLTNLKLPVVLPGGPILAENASQMLELAHWDYSGLLGAQILPEQDQIFLGLADQMVLYDPQNEAGTQQSPWPPSDTGWSNPGAIFSPDGSLVAYLRGSCPAESIRCQIDVQPANGGPSLFTLETDVLSAFAISRDNRFVVIGGSEGLAVYSLEDGHLITTLPESLFFDRIAIAPDGSRVAGFVYMSEHVDVWSLPEGELAYRLEPPAYRGVFFPNNVAFSPDGQILAVGANGLIGLWQAAGGEELLFWQPHDSEIGSLAFSPDGTLLASSDWNGRVVISAVNSGQVLHTFQGSDTMIWQLGFAAQGALLVTFDSHGVMRLWGIPPQ